MTELILKNTDNTERRTDEQILSDAYRMFFSAMTQGTEEDIVNTAVEIFRSPVLLTDENYRLLYQYPKEKIGSDVWDNLLEYGALPLDTVKDYIESYLDGSDVIYQPFYADWGLAREYPRIFGEVYSKEGKILGHVAIFLIDRPFRPLDLKLAKIFTDALTIPMLHKNSAQLATVSYLYDLLEEETSEYLRILSAKVLAKRMKGKFALMVTCIENNVAQQTFATSAVIHMNKAYRNTISTVFQNYIVTLFGEMSGDGGYTEKEKRFLQSVGAFLLQSFSYVGVSMSFEDPFRLTDHLEQCKLITELKKKGIFFFQDVASEVLFVPVIKEIKPSLLMHPVLEKLSNYDKEHGSEYFRTLQEFCFSMQNNELSASKLCIHRNTLLYRLNRIKELFDIHPEQPEEARYLLNSFQIWNILHSK